MRQKAFTRPAPIKTNISPKIQTTVVTTTTTTKKRLPVHLPLTPLSPRTESELRRSCSRLLSSLSATSSLTSNPNSGPDGKSAYIPSNAARSFNQATNKFMTPSESNSDTSVPESTLTKGLARENTIAKPPTPPSSNGIIPPYNFSKTALARKMSLNDARRTRTPSPPTGTSSNANMAEPHTPLRTPTRTSELLQAPTEPVNPDEIGQAKPFESSAVQVPIGLKRKPSLIRVTPRPKTSGGNENRVEGWVQQELERRRNEGTSGKEKLVLFPRPNTSHSMKAGSQRKELTERPLPPLPQIPTRSKTMDHVTGPLRGLRRQLSLFFGRRKDQHARPSPVPSKVRD